MTETEFKHRYVHGYALTDFFAAVTILLLLFVILTKRGVVPLALSVLLGGISFASQVVFGKAHVFNNSSSTTEAKEENGRDIIEVQPGSVSPAIDGVRVGDAVYKLPVGVHATIDTEGNLKAHSLTGKFLLAIAGGRLAKAPDQYWQPLFGA